MTGLMMMFMLVAVIFMLKVENEKAEIQKLRVEAENQAQRIKTVAILYGDLKEQLYNDFSVEFRDDLPRWRATLDRNLAIRFEEPDVLFDTGKSVIKPAFAQILEDFFPRYARILASQKYRESVEEILHRRAHIDDVGCDFGDGCRLFP